jgi:hypothetical protein
MQEKGQQECWGLKVADYQHFAQSLPQPIERQEQKLLNFDDLAYLARPAPRYSASSMPGKEA